MHCAWERGREMKSKLLCFSSDLRSKSFVAEYSEAETTRGVFLTGTVHSLGLLSEQKPSMSLAAWVPTQASPVAESRPSPRGRWKPRGFQKASNPSRSFAQCMPFTFKTVFVMAL